MRRLNLLYFLTVISPFFMGFFGTQAVFSLCIHHTLTPLYVSVPLAVLAVIGAGFRPTMGRKIRERQDTVRTIERKAYYSA